MFGAAGQGAHDEQVKDDERVRAQVVMDVVSLGHGAWGAGVGVALLDAPTYQALSDLTVQSDGT